MLYYFLDIPNILVDLIKGIMYYLIHSLEYIMTPLKNMHSRTLKLFTGENNHAEGNLEGRVI